ncbi:MAG TPA: hypothetical protein VJV03_10135 [Pyrinomonadaceae bacterium]|nr:hypothetical protein [Pyrinomonadaceae bacterium]
MEASAISQIVRDEIAGNWSVSNAHGVDLKRCLVAPTRRDYADPIVDGRSLSMWLVLEEVPEDQSGYKIVFDEITHQFGLATGDSQRNHDVFLGFYGTFLETLEAM